jgi:hypothetical protein
MTLLLSRGYSQRDIHHLIITALISMHTFTLQLCSPGGQLPIEFCPSILKPLIVIPIHTSILQQHESGGLRPIAS